MSIYLAPDPGRLRRIVDRLRIRYALWRIRSCGLPRGWVELGYTDDSVDGETWECMLCHRTRPDDAISVAWLPIVGAEAEFPATRWNVRYCNDDPDCVAAAPGYGL
jgi:hypothetical protein